MKNTQITLTILLLALLSIPAMAQEIKENIKERFIIQNQAIVEKDFEKATEYMADEIFEMMSKEDFINVMTASFNNPQMEIVSSVPDVISIGEPEKVGEKYYVILEGKSLQKMRFFDTEQNVLGFEDPMITGVMSNLNSTFGEESVSFNKETNFIEVDLVQNYVAISQDGKTGWKFLAIDKSMIPMLGQLLPEEIIAKVKG